MEIKVQKHLLGDAAAAHEASAKQMSHQQGPGADNKQAPERAIQLICPLPELVTSADPLKIKVVTTFPELYDAVGSDIIAVESPRLLAMLLDYADVFDVQPIVVLGVPSAVYSAAFEQATWDLDRVAYDTLVADLKANAMVDQIKEKEAGVRPPKPRRPGRDPAKVPATRFTDFDAASSSIALAEEADDAVPGEDRN